MSEYTIKVTEDIKVSVHLTPGQQYTPETFEGTGRLFLAVAEMIKAWRVRFPRKERPS